MTFYDRAKSTVVPLNYNQEKVVNGSFFQRVKQRFLFLFFFFSDTLKSDNTSVSNSDSGRIIYPLFSAKCRSKISNSDIL